MYTFIQDFMYVQIYLNFINQQIFSSVFAVWWCNFLADIDRLIQILVI